MEKESGSLDVTVVIPLFNGRKWIGDALESVTAQSVPPQEIVVVDDGSTDGSRAVVEDIPGVRLLSNPKNGPYEARNHGAKATDTEKVAFVDQDDLWHPDHLKRVQEAFQAFPGCTAVFADTAKFRSGESPSFSARNGRAHRVDPWDTYPKNTLGEPVGGVIRRDAFQEIGGWSPHLEGCGDYEMWLELALLGDIASTGCTTAGHRVHDASLSQQMRAEESTTYFSLYVTASEEALEKRRKEGLSTDPYARRLKAQQALLDLLYGLADQDTSRMREATKRFASCMSPEPPSVVRELWDSFTWYAEPILKERGSAGFAVHVIDWVHSWSEESEPARSFLHEWAVGRASTLDLVRRHPSEPSYWGRLLRRGGRKLRDRLGR